MKIALQSLWFWCFVLWTCAAVAETGNASPGIEVRTDVPFGNAANVRVTKEGATHTVRFTPHPHGGPESLWFCFQLRAFNPQSITPGDVRLVLEGAENLLGGQRLDRFRPVHRAPGGEWERLPAPEITRLPDGRREAVWILRMATGQADVAFSYPYGREEVDKLLSDSKGFWKVDTIGVSQGGRPLLRLSNDYGSPKGQRRGVYLLARQHSGEVSGSWVLDGLLRRLAEAGENAPLVWVTPLANIDGIEHGDYGKDNFPYDLNRAWGEPPMRHEVLVLQRDMRRWAQRCRPIAGMDFHSPGGGESRGIFAFLGASEKQPEASQQAVDWATEIAQSLRRDFAAEKFLTQANYKSRWETPRFTNFCQDELGIPGITIEVPYGMIHDEVMTRESYQEAGRRIADVLIRRGQL